MSLRERIEEAVSDLVDAALANERRGERVALDAAGDRLRAVLTEVEERPVSTYASVLGELRALAAERDALGPGRCGLLTVCTYVHAEALVPGGIGVTRWEWRDAADRCVTASSGPALVHAYRDALTGADGHNAVGEVSS